ncbi:MAG TPA: hypothetical protein VGC79_07720, partial [Polyangiaceae bacterium]
MNLGHWVIALALGYAGCTGYQDVARARAVTDLHCRPEQIAVYDVSRESAVASGCGVWTEYQCFGTGHGLTCVREAPAQVNASPPPPPKP